MPDLDVEIPDAEDKTPAEGEAENSTDGSQTDKGGEKKEAEAEKEEVQEIVLKLPAESLLDDADLDRIKTEAKAKGFSQKDAEVLLAKEHSYIQGVQAKQKKQLDAMKESWKKEVENDPVLGGKDAVKHREACKRAVAEISKGAGVQKDFEQILNVTGLGDNPVFIKVFKYLGEKMADGKFAKQVKPSGHEQVKTRAEKFYGDSTNKKED